MFSRLVFKQRLLTNIGLNRHNNFFLKSVNTSLMDSSHSRQISTVESMRHDYNENSQVQGKTLISSKKYIEQGIDALTTKIPDCQFEGPEASRSVTIADFGSSTGANSSVAMSLIIERLRGRFSPDHVKSIQVIHNDLAANGWTTAFNYFHSNPNSYLKKHDGVFAVASGMSYFEQIMPSNSLYFGYSNYSLHWLSKLPVKIENHCSYHFGTPQEQKAFRDIAEKDWNDFLTARSHELVRGGVLVLHCRSMKKPKAVSTDTLYQSAKKLKEHGFITEDELHEYNIPIYFRSLAEITNRRLFDSLGLEILTAEEVPASYNAHYEAFKVHKNVEKFASDYTSYLGAALEQIFTKALSPTRDKQFLADLFWQEFREKMKSRPHEFGTTSSHLYLVIRKK